MKSFEVELRFSGYRDFRHFEGSWRSVHRVKYATRTIAAMATTHSTIRSQRGMCSQPWSELPVEWGSGATISWVIGASRLLRQKTEHRQDCLCYRVKGWCATRLA
jgi:hypothetical protein